jgi:hypothetical protein
MSSAKKSPRSQYTSPKKASTSSRAIVPSKSKATVPRKTSVKPKSKSMMPMEPQFQMYAYSARYNNNEMPEEYEAYLDNDSGYQTITQKGKTTKKVLSPSEKKDIMCQAMTNLGLPCLNNAQYRLQSGGKYVCSKHH